MKMIKQFLKNVCCTTFNYYNYLTYKFYINQNLMKKIVFFLLILNIQVGIFAQNLNYYLPDSITYNKAIPTPKDIIFHEPGEWHVTHDRLVNYMKAIATAAPDRVKLETMGYTYENRPQVLLIITSPKNQLRLEEIRQQHFAII